MALTLLQLITPVFGLISLFDQAQSSKRMPRVAFALTVGPFWLYFRTVLLLSVSPLVVVAVLLSRRGADLANDALAWCSDDAFRDQVMDECRKRVESNGANANVLIGHSQGGSILTELTRTHTFEADTMLMTLGSGQALLATLFEIRKHTILTLLSVFLLTVTYLLGFLTILAPTLPDFGSRLIESGRDLLLYLQILWSSPVADPEKARFFMEDSAQRSMVAAIESIQEAPRDMPTGLTTRLALLNGLMFVAISGFLIPTGNAILERTRSAAPGLDIISSHDPVSRVLNVMGVPRRLCRIPQTYCLTTDHTAYYENGVGALPRLVNWIEMSGSLTYPELHQRQREALVNADYEHASQLWPVRVLRPMFGLFLAAPMSVAISQATSRVLPQYVALAAGFVAAYAVARTWAKYVLARNSALSPEDRSSLANAGAQRRCNRSWPKAVILGAIALPMLGASIQPVAGGWVTLVPDGQVGRLEALGGVAAPTFGVLALGAILFLRGSRLARLIGVIGLWMTSCAWFGLSEASSLTTGVTLLALSVWIAKPRGSTLERN